MAIIHQVDNILNRLMAQYRGTVGFNSSGNYIFRFTNNTGAARSNVSFSRESPMIIYYIEVASS